MSSCRTIALLALLLAPWSSHAYGAGEGEAGGLDDKEIVERVVELRRQLDALLDALPEELRAEIERRLSEEAATPEAGSVGEEAGERAPVEGADQREAPVEEAATASGACVHLQPFDSNGDGALSGLDRYWRYFKLWADDADDEIEEPEIRNLYDSGVAAMPVALRRYTAVEGEDGEVWVGESVEVELAGRKARRAVLVIDADRLASGEEYWLADEDGEPLSGLQPVRRGLRLVSAAGESRSMLCP